MMMVIRSTGLLTRQALGRFRGAAAVTAVPDSHQPRGGGGRHQHYHGLSTVGMNNSGHSLHTLIPSNQGGMALAGFNESPFVSQQTRSFASKNKKKKGGGGGGGGPGGGGGGGGGGTVQVYMVYDGEDEDIREVPSYQDAERLKMTPKLPQFMEDVGDTFGIDTGDEDDDESSSMKIYHSQSKTFVPLTSMNQVQEEQKKGGKVFLAPPDDPLGDDDFPEDPDDDENYPDDVNYSDDEGEDPYGFDSMVDKDTLLETVYDVARSLRQAGWTRIDDDDKKMLVKSEDGSQQQHTHKVILGLAETDEDLQRLLVRHVGALEHIVTCVHFDFVWDNKKPKDDDDEMMEGEVVNETL